MWPLDEREDRLGLGEQVEVEAGLADAPRLDRVVRLGNHGDPAPESAGHSTTMDRAVRPQRLGGVATRSTPTTIAEAAGPARLDPGDARPRRRPPAAGLDAEPSAAAARKVSGCGLPRRSSVGGDDTVDAHLEQVGDAGRGEHLAAVGAGRDDRPPQPGVARGPQVGHRARVRLDALARGSA